MTARERVALALNHKKADRTPRYDIILPEFTERWIKARNLPPDADVYETFKNIDIGMVLGDAHGPLLTKAHILYSKGGEKVEVDSWGRTVKTSDIAYFESQLAPAFTEKSEFFKLDFDDPQDDARYEELARIAKERSERFAPVSGMLGLFMGSYRMRGEEQFLVDLAEDPVFCKEMITRLAEFKKRQGVKVVQATDTFDTALWIYDEFSSRLGPLFSPKVYENVFMPVYKDLIAYLKKEGIKNFILHCDGNCLPLLDMLIECGFTGHQSPAPSAGMRLTEIKKRYPKFIMVGGMCNIHTLAGTFAEIEKEAKAILEAARDGGVIIGTHSIDDHIPVENYEFYDNLLNEYCYGN